MKKVRRFMLFQLILVKSLLAQEFGDAGACQKNVNDPQYQVAPNSNMINSVFKLSIDGLCTGTLINRNTNDGDVGFYFITAHHCVKDVDFSNDFTLYFNYQSPDANSSSTHSTNQGLANSQSSNILPNGYEYKHISKLNLIEDYSWGDFALCEIVTPLPPHFNYNYAGWNSSLLLNGVSIGNTPNCGTLPNLYTTVHHPEGDIKKISGTQRILKNYSSLSTGCYTITTIIDILFGWIWNQSFSTQVICNYVDIPWYTVPQWCYGSTQSGSSGAVMFNSNDKIVGVLSGGLSGCSFSMMDFYGPFKSSYFRQGVRNKLNPNNDLTIDLLGLGGRKISCYQNLQLPGVSGVSGEYFPASHYQSENKVILQAEEGIDVISKITIHDGADYEFKAGNHITYGPNSTTSYLEIELGATFSGTIEQCSANRSASNETVMINQIRQTLTQIELPFFKEFSVQKETNDENLTYQPNKLLMKAFPNPNDGVFEINISYFGNESTMGVLDLYNNIGSVVFRVDLNLLTSRTHKVFIDKNLPVGFYTARFKTSDCFESMKIIIK
ncbi:MAG TPA: T9SS type A sorting domain-containing protein [Bacteroidia bacterium]|nr:T9SS type A sorting domain-containing protein [Bacteroidia bacterium]HRH08753.1 T9SS type A sorting domain-containing protein [Bacteroidia bacterium]